MELSTPVLDMLSTKYVIVADSLPNASLLQNIRPVFNNGKVSIYRNLKALPRAWFVQDTLVVADPAKRIRILRSADFDPAFSAILEEEITGISAPDSASVTQIKAGLHELAYEYHSDTDALLILSEIYYPAGWKAFVDGIEIPIYPANHILRALKVPAGEHKLELVMKPDSYAIGIKLSLAGILITILAVFIGAYFHFKKRNNRTTSVNRYIN